jgi:hypothetical protein
VGAERSVTPVVAVTHNRV